MLRKTLLASASLATILAAYQVSAQSSTKTYTYDALGRLVQVEISGGSADGENRDYSYDDASNRTQVIASKNAPAPTPTPSLSIDDASAAEGNSISFTITLSEAGTSTITTQYATSSAGSASANDFSARSGTLSFSAGQTSKTVSVPTIEDSAVEPNETFYLDLSSPSGATIADSRGVGTITNDDIPSLSIGDAAATEGSAVSFIVTLNSAASSTVSVRYSTAENTARSSDFTASSGVLNFSPGETSKSFSVPTTQDNTFESNETFYAELSFPNGATIADSRGIGTILNDDVEAIPAISITGASGNEGNAVIFTIRLSSAYSSSISMSYATANGSASSASDYFTTNGTLTFSPGETSKEIWVLTRQDTLVESDETLSLILSSPTNGATFSNDRATGTIVDDDTLSPPDECGPGGVLCL